MKSMPGIRAAFRGVLRCLSAAPLSLSILGADWPQFLGPDRNGVSLESISSTLPVAGPKTRWSTKVGSGWSSPVVVGSQIALHHRVGDEELLEAWTTDGGRPLWRSAEATRYRDGFGFDNGPRGTPCVVNGRVYTFGAEGRLTARNWQTGQIQWSRALAQELKAESGFFGFACSPLVVSNKIIVQVGGVDGSGIVAVRTEDGTVVWKATDDEAGYAAPILAENGGRRRLIVFNRAGLSVLDSETGKVHSRRSWRSRSQASVNATTPLALPQGIFLTASYGTGAILLDTTEPEPKTIWTNDESLSSHYSPVVASGDFLFGYHGRQEQGANFRCVETATGRVRWSDPTPGAGSVIRASGTLILLRESGELQLAPASGKAFEPTPRVQVLGTETRATPALAGGVLFARDRHRLVAVELNSTAP